MKVCACCSRVDSYLSLSSNSREASLSGSAGLKHCCAAISRNLGTPRCVPAAFSHPNKISSNFDISDIDLLFNTILTTFSIPMRGFIFDVLRRKRPLLSTQPQTSGLGLKRAFPDVPTGSAQPQKHCSLFTKLLPELRLLVYGAALVHSQHLLHILHATPHNSGPEQMGHWRCDDFDCQYPTWQHRCFGCWAEGNTLYIRKASYTNSDLLSLLLTCRLM